MVTIIVPEGKGPFERPKRDQFFSNKGSKRDKNFQKRGLQHNDENTYFSKLMNMIGYGEVYMSFM